MKDSFLFNISNQKGLPNGANETKSNVFGAMSFVNNSGPRASANEDIDQDAMLGMMKARMAYEEMHGNPAAKRMVVAPDNPYQFDNGYTGTHYMGSYDDYAVPNIQEVDGKLEMTGPIANEEMKFDRPEDAAYFSENYKKIAPDSSYREFEELELTDDEIEEYRAGGYVVEEFNDGGDNGKKSKYVKNVMSLLEKDGVLPLDLVYGNKELGIPKMGTLEGLKSIPEVKDYFFDPYGNERDSYIEQRGNPEERKAATQRKRDDYLYNVGRTEEEEQAYQEKKSEDQSIADAKAREEECNDPASECYKARVRKKLQASRDYDDSGQFVRDLGSMIGDQYAELTYKPIERTAKKAWNDPMGLVNDLGTTANDIKNLPFTLAKESYDYFLGDGNFEGSEIVDMDALATTGDALSFIPLAKGVQTGLKTAKPIIKYADNVLMNAPRAQMTLNSGVNPGMMVNAYQDARNAVKGMKFPFSKTGRQLDQIKGSGAYWDDVGIPGKDLVSKTDMVEYVGTKSGRPVVNVKMPDGTTQSFYKSSGWAGKAGDGVGGTTEGMWQPFGGFTKHPKVKNGDWFIKDAGYKDFYGSQTYKDIAGELDNALIKKFDLKNTDELDNVINFQNRNRPGDDFIPDYNHGGPHKSDEYRDDYFYSDDGNTYTEIIGDTRPYDDYEYKRVKDKTTGDLSYFTRKKGTDTWGTAGAEGTRGYRAITDVFGEDTTGYATSQAKKDFNNELLAARTQENEESTGEDLEKRKAEMRAYYKQSAPFMSDTQIDMMVAELDKQAKNPSLKTSTSAGEALYGKKQPVFGGPSRSDKVVAGGSDFDERDKSASEIGIGDGKTAKEAATEFVKAVPGMIAEGSGFNAAKSLYNKGATQVIGDLANTAADIVGGTGEALYEAGDYFLGDGSFDMSGTNWITGNQYGSGLDTVLDIASIIPAAGVVGKVGKFGKYTKPFINPVKNTVKTAISTGRKGINKATDFLGDIKLGTVAKNTPGATTITLGDVGNTANSLLKYNPLQRAGINTGLTNKYGTGWGVLTAMGVDNTVRGDNTFSDIASGNFDLNKSALGRYTINAADDLSLINESRKNQATKNTINEGYTFGDAAKIGINLSPMKFLGNPVSSSLKAEAQLSQAPKYISKAFKKATDKYGVYAHEDIQNDRPVKTAGFKQEGGISNYNEQYLTDEEIQALIAQGYRIEDIS